MSEYITTGPDDPTPLFEDVSERQRGFTEATVGMIEIWDAYKAEYKEDPAAVFAMMDAFLLGCMVRMTGASINECATVMNLSRDASSVLTDKGSPKEQ